MALPFHSSSVLVNIIFVLWIAACIMNCVCIRNNCVYTDVILNCVYKPKDTLVFNVFSLSCSPAPFRTCPWPALRWNFAWLSFTHYSGFPCSCDSCPTEWCCHTSKPVDVLLIFLLLININYKYSLPCLYVTHLNLSSISLLFHSTQALLRFYLHHICVGLLSLSFHFTVSSFAYPLSQYH